MIRVAHIITGLETGGAEMMLKKVVLARKNVEHAVISLSDLGTIGPDIAAHGIPVFALNPRKVKLLTPFLIAKLARFVSEANADVLQGWMYHGNLATVLARAYLRRQFPICWSIRCSIGNERLVTAAVRNYCALISRFASSTIYNSANACAQHEALGYERSNSVIIPNGFDTSRFKPDSNSRARVRNKLGVADTQFLVGHVSRLHKMKDQETLVRAAYLVHKAFPNAKFILAGRDLPSLAQNSNVAVLISQMASCIVLLPEQRDVGELMNGFDLFTLSSSFGEGFPNVLGEALSSGLPCVATDVGDCARIVGEAGRVVPPRSPQELAAAILDIAMSTHGYRAQLGERARTRAIELFSLSKIVNLYESQWLGAVSSWH